MPNLEATSHFDFFAAQRDWMREMKLQGALLLPTSDITREKIALHSCGMERIDADQYDHFLIVGLGFGICGPGFISPFSVFRRYRIAGFDGLREETNSYISRPCLAALTESILRNSTALYLARLLRSVSDARIFVIPTPYPSEEILVSEDERFWRRAVECGAWGYANALYTKMATQTAADTGCEILFQPDKTFAHNSFTKAKYSHGSIRLAADMDHVHPPSEFFHMNALYGAELLKSYAELIEPSRKRVGELAC
jgi:hypothetical protein